MKRDTPVSKYVWASLRAGLYLFAGVALGAGATFAWRYLQGSAYFELERVYLQGEFQHVTPAQVEARLRPLARGNLLRLDLDSLRAAVLGLPWVHDVQATRLWPHAVALRIREQHLVASWNGNTFLNDDADVVDLGGDGAPANLPALEGPDGTQAQVLDTYRRLAAIMLPAGRAVAMLALSPRRSWDVTLDNGLRLVLGRETPDAKVARFARVYAQVVGQRTDITKIDLRYANGFAVQSRAGAKATGTGAG